MGKRNLVQLSLKGQRSVVLCLLRPWETLGLVVAQHVEGKVEASRMLAFYSQHDGMTSRHLKYKNAAKK